MKTATELADILAMRQLVFEYKLSLWWHHTAWAAQDLGEVQRRGYGETDIAAVRAWAEAAGVPWPKIEAVEMFAVVDQKGIAAISEKQEEAEHNSRLWGIGKVVPCVVVMNREGE